MEHNHPTPVSLLVSIISAIFAWISIQNAQVLLGFAASIVAIGSGGMAIRYYYYATKEKKQNIQNSKNQP